MYRRLQPSKIISTLETLGRRIGERFPGSGLENVCNDLTGLARDTSVRAGKISQPNIWLKSLVWFLIASAAALLTVVGYTILTSTKTSDDLFSTLQGIDSGFNILVLMGASLYFLSSLEMRLKQRRALMALHEFRSIVHVIDMHQLTKDPSMMGAARTSTSPERDMTPFELTRYLDYCSEMLSLTAKCAALYAENLSDPVVVDTVGDIERLTSDLSSKIWQKITIIQSLEGGRDLPLPIPAPPHKPVTS